MTLLEHLNELRRRLIISMLAITAGAVVAFAFYGRILRFLEHPLCHVLKHSACVLYVTSPLDPLGIRIKIGAYGGFALALPVVLFQLWRFVTPGLNPKEKRYSVPFIAASVFFFAFGGVMAWLTFPHALAWLTHIGGPGLRPIYTPSDYLQLILLLMLMYGIAFEFPVVLVSLEIARVLTPAKLSQWRRWSIVIIAAFAAIITPSSDPFSMLGMAIPMYVFYEMSIVVGKILKR